MFTNAFYAVHDKKKTAALDFKPKVEVSTKTIHTLSGGPHGVEIRVKDNGSGIPDAIKDKIMQPFFTTKPAGEGTGLGLSLSYDIIVKAHKGKIDINSKEGEGTEFVITLPMQ
jgi:signal transduction histidine kinase